MHQLQSLGEITVILAMDRSGGIQGGISNGENIVVRLAFKPTSTISRKQRTVNRDGQEVDLIARGRHDPCVVPRAVPMVEAMVAITLADQLMQVSPPLLGASASGSRTVGTCHRIRLC